MHFVIVFLKFLSPCGGEARRGRNQRAIPKNAMIVAAQPESTEAGAEILKAGGNAVDAAMACALVQGVVDPLMCGIAGFGSCGIAMPGKGFHGYIDFHAPAPRAVRPDMWADLIESEARDGYGFILRGRVNDIGYQSICAPASLRAYRDAHREHGRLPWEQIVEPAIAWAEGGWTVRPHVRVLVGGRGPDGPRAEPRAPGVHAGRPGALLPARRHAQARGRPRGESRPRPDAAPHRQARRRSCSTRARSPRPSSRTCADTTALIALEDLRDWRTTRNAPLWGAYRGYRVSSNRPPGGGVMLLEMLNILEHFDLAGLEHNSAEYVRVVAEAMKRATIDKDRHVGDPAFVDVPVDHLTGKAYAAVLAAEIRAGEKAQRAALQRRRRAEPRTRRTSPSSTPRATA